MSDELEGKSDRKVTFREILARDEYRAIYLAFLVSWLGDYLARAAITVLVYQQTDSAFLSAAAFAITYLPWIIGGPLLATLAERHSYRRVMILCDLARMGLVLLLIIPGQHWTLVLTIAFLATLGTPPTQAARSAMLPQVLDREQLPVALTLNATTLQAAQVVGYLAGAALAIAIDPRLAIGIDAVTFAISALLIVLGVRSRPPAETGRPRQHLLREAGEGFRMVFGSHVLRAIALMVYAASAFAIVPEGLAAAWAAQSNPDEATRGLDQGMIMAANPVGFVIGGILLNRFLTAARRERLTRPLAVAAPLVLVPALAAPPPPVVAGLVLLSGAAVGGLLPNLNARFVLALPHGYRARAFGVIQQGLQLSQGGAVMITGLIADRAPVPLVVGVWSIGGVLAMLAMVGRWPSARAFHHAIEAAARGGAPPPAPGEATAVTVPAKARSALGTATPAVTSESG
ncbi:MFS transporter [Mangrovihabitans endophyticus]|uniref:MFS transporter n=1 Tax=Mangrovihabitans endophyticus TaxID=1751298 RepID=UPI001E35360E|nr:MFS transporter [Mangrovihabitans endophyticus]